MKKSFVLYLVSILLLGTACGPAPDPSVSMASDEIADIIEQYRQEIPERMQQEKVTGLAIVVVDDQNILWSDGFGHTNYDHLIPVTPKTLFSIQSMSKSFTATAVMFAAQEGLVDLDEPITTYLSDFHVNSIFEEHPELKITLRMLLSHTAGFAHEAPIGGNNDLPGRTFEEHIASISDTWLRFPVGTRWAYSNLGIDLAGYILQVRSGMPFTQYVKEKVLDPLGMMDSTLDIHEVRATSDRAVGHSLMPFRPPAEFLIIPSGGVWTTAHDIARYLQFHINEGALNGQRLLRQELAETMYESPNPAALHAEYALGIGTAPWQGTRRFQHGGGGFGFNSNMVWYPELKLGAVVLSNFEDAGLNMQLVDDVLNSIISANIPLYHSRASTVPSVEPAYGFNRNGPPILSDTALGELIASKALPLQKSAREKYQNYLGSYVQTRWGFPLLTAQIKENNGTLTTIALGQTIVLSQVQPGLFFDPEGNFYNIPNSVSTAPNYPLFKMDSQFLPLRRTFYVLCGLIFLFTLLFRPLRVLLQRIRGKNSAGETTAAGGPQSRWLIWIGRLSGLASLTSLLCLGIIALIPNLMYVPWPRPYTDLTWWQFAWLSLPFASLLLAAGITLMVLSRRSYLWARAICWYYIAVNLTILAFNIALIV